MNRKNKFLNIATVVAMVLGMLTFMTPAVSAHVTRALVSPTCEGWSVTAAKDGEYGTPAIEWASGDELSGVWAPGQTTARGVFNARWSDGYPQNGISWKAEKPGDCTPQPVLAYPALAAIAPAACGEQGTAIRVDADGVSHYSDVWYEGLTAYAMAYAEEGRIFDNGLTETKVSTVVEAATPCPELVWIITDGSYHCDRTPPSITGTESEGYYDDNGEFVPTGNTRPIGEDVDNGRPMTDEEFADAGCKIIIHLVDPVVISSKVCDVPGTLDLRHVDGATWGEPVYTGNTATVTLTANEGYEFSNGETEHVFRDIDISPDTECVIESWEVSTITFVCEDGGGVITVSDADTIPEDGGTILIDILHNGQSKYDTMIPVVHGQSEYTYRFDTSTWEPGSVQARAGAMKQGNNIDRVSDVVAFPCGEEPEPVELQICVLFQGDAKPTEFNFSSVQEAIDVGFLYEDGELILGPDIIRVARIVPCQDEPSPSPTPTTPSPTPTTPVVTPSPTEVPTQEPTQPTKPPTNGGDGGTDDTPVENTAVTTGLPKTGTGDSKDNSNASGIAVGLGLAFVTIVALGGLYGNRRRA